MRLLRCTALLVAVALPATASAGGNAAKLAKLDAKAGFRGAKLGTDFATFEGLEQAGKRGNRLLFTRASDKLMLFDTRLASVVYGFEDALLETIVITGAWTLDPKMRLCEGNNDHVAENLRKVFGAPTKTHAYSSPEGKRCVREHGGDLTAPYCRVYEWRTGKVRLSFFGVVTTSPGAAPADVKPSEEWTGHSCRFALEYKRITDPADDL